MVTPDLPNGEMVQRFDCYIYRDARGPARPGPGRDRRNQSRALPPLRQTLERDRHARPRGAGRAAADVAPSAGLIDRYLHVPPAYRGQHDGEGISVDERLVEGLGAGREALDDITERLARQDVAAFETQGRFIKSRYGEDGELLPVGRRRDERLGDQSASAGDRSRPP